MSTVLKIFACVILVLCIVFFVACVWAALIVGSDADRDAHLAWEKYMEENERKEV